MAIGDIWHGLLDYGAIPAEAGEDQGEEGGNEEEKGVEVIEVDDSDSEGEGVEVIELGDSDEDVIEVVLPPSSKLDEVDLFESDVEVSVVVDCPICMRRLNRPKFLSCEHVICRPCLHWWRDKNPRKLCPVCPRSA